MKVLIAEDSPTAARELGMILKGLGYGQVVDARDVDQATEFLRRDEDEEIGAAIVDWNLPDRADGTRLLAGIRELRRATPVYVIMVSGTLYHAREAIEAGADDFLQKPVADHLVSACLQKAMKQARRDREQQMGHLALLAARAAGHDFVLTGLEETLKRVVKFAPDSSTVLLRGPTGSGKDVLARMIHDLSPRKDKPFVVVNCGALIETLVEAEFLGHVKGSAAEAFRDHPGLFQMADKGTLFLDEVAELSLKAQQTLLRVIQDKRVRPVRGEKEIPVDVRIIAATHRPLEELVDRGKFRQDLLMRIKVLEIFVPSIQDRRDAFQELADRLYADIRKEKGRLDLSEGLPADVMQALVGRPWKGNVREMRNVLEQAVLLADGTALTLADIRDAGTAGSSNATARDGTWNGAFPCNGEALIDAFTARLIRQARDGASSYREAARRLTMAPSTFDSKVARLRKLGFSCEPEPESPNS